MLDHFVAPFQISILLLKKKQLFLRWVEWRNCPLSLSCSVFLLSLSLALCSWSCRLPAPSAPSSLSELCRPQLPRTSRVSGATVGTFAKESLRCSIRLVLSRAKVRRQMGRHKVELKQIEDKSSHQVTFSNRRSGLFKKAHQLAILATLNSLWSSFRKLQALWIIQRQQGICVGSTSEGSLFLS